MPQAVRSNSITTPPEPPPLEIINSTLDPYGWCVQNDLARIYPAEQVEEFRTVFIARHLIADEIERLLAILDSLSGDDDLEGNMGGECTDPRLDDAEGDAPDDEPSISAFDGMPIYYGNDDLECDATESGEFA